VDFAFFKQRHRQSLNLIDLLLGGLNAVFSRVYSAVHDHAGLPDDRSGRCCSRLRKDLTWQSRRSNQKQQQSNKWLEPLCLCP
jgi:hypothetical protein